MNRNYNITYKNYTKNSINHTNVDVDNIDNIINHSANSIYCSCLNYIEPSKIDFAIQTIFNKIKPNGIVTFNIVDVKGYAKDFINGIIGGGELLTALSNFQSILCIEDFYTRIDINTFIIKQVIKSNDSIEIVIERTKI